jgi:N-acetylglucosaminyl-diphospho-decaprenol L-rhamnosyltransferase
MRITIVTVLHDSAEHLGRLLDSLDRHAPGQQVVAVDTGSADGGPDLARRRGCEVIELPGNPGFGAANNAGVARAAHDVTALLNPDVELLDDGLLRLAQRVDADPDALLFPRLLNTDGTIQDSAHPRPGTLREILRAFVPARIAPQPYRATSTREVGWAIAAVLVAHTGTLRRLGPFDPDAFLYYEDLDLCLRAGRCVLHPDVALRHAGGHSTGPDRLRREAERRREVVRARLGERALRRDDLAQAITFARAAVRSPRARAQLRALRVARRA